MTSPLHSATHRAARHGLRGGLLLLALLVALTLPRPAPAAAADDLGAPYRMIVLLEIAFPSGAHAGCTGFMVGPHTVGTAGHCLRSATEGRASAIRVIPGVSGLTAPYGTFLASGFTTTTAWDATQDNRYDFGTVTLPTDDLGNITGWFSIGSASDLSLILGTFGTAGYREDRTYATMWGTSGPISTYDDSFLYYHWDTTHGDSGSPIWVAAPGGYRVIGIVKGLLTGSTGVVLTDFGIRVTPPVADYFAARTAEAFTPQPRPAVRPFFTTTPGSPIVLQGDSWPKAATAELQVSSDLVRWTTIQTAATDAAGHVEYRLNPTVTQYYRHVVLGAAPGEPGQGIVTSNAPALLTPASVGFAAPPAFGGGMIAQVVFLGGTVDDLESATRAAGATGVWAQDATGVYRLLPIGAPAFVRAPFLAAFPNGFAVAAAVTLTR